MSIEIASVFCHRLSQEAVGMRKQLNSRAYLDNTDNGDRRRYSCDVIKIMRATEATCSATSKAIATAIFRGQSDTPGSGNYTLHSPHVIRGIYQSLLKHCWCIFYFVYDVISAYSTYESFNSATPEKNFETCLKSYRWRCIGLSCKLSKTASYFSRPIHSCLAWTKWCVRDHCFTRSLLIITGGMWQMLTRYRQAILKALVKSNKPLIHCHSTLSAAVSAVLMCTFRKSIIKKQKTRINFDNRLCDYRLTSLQQMSFSLLFQALQHRILYSLD